ncbi:MAG TPA: serine/threonine-protein kinase [Hyphomicrobiaceae bacterium]|nr:serine/threonine-protein kinase [Hyphomicrobiaceae bacterium]
MDTRDTRLSLPEGTILDTYLLCGVIGSGGFGITYRAEDVNLKTPVALKEYYPADFGDREADMSVRPKSERHKASFEWGRASFLKEAQMLALFRHPGIVRVTRVFEANSTAYMVMDFEQGQSLESWLRGIGRAPTQSELDNIALPVLDALELMHAKSFLHRDIAPDNIIVRPDGSPVLIDFGAARHAVGQMSRSLTRIIKAGYSPTEQYAAAGSLQGPWSDLYALGATLYRAVSGRPPEEATLRMDEDAMVPAVHAAGRSYRRRFLEAIDACLRVKASERPQSVAQLRPMLMDDGAASERAGSRPIVRRAVRGRRGGRWMAAAMLPMLLGALYAGVEYSRLAPGESGRDGARSEGDRKAASRGEAAQEDQGKAAAEAEARRAAAEQAEQERRKAAAAAEEERQAAEREAAAKAAIQSEAAAEARAAAEAKRLEDERLAAARRAAEEEARSRQEAEEERRKAAAAKKADELRKKAEEERQRKEKAAAAAQRRPDPLRYSNEVWAAGEIPHMQVVSRRTQYGVLSCRGGNLSTGARRECWWQ